VALHSSGQLATSALFINDLSLCRPRRSCSAIHAPRDNQGMASGAPPPPPATARPMQAQKRLLNRVLFSGCKIRRENLWLVYLHPTTNQRFSLRILQPEKRTLLLNISGFHEIILALLIRRPHDWVAGIVLAVAPYNRPRSCLLLLFGRCFGDAFQGAGEKRGRLAPGHYGIAARGKELIPR
jgi:hypothetical protein